MDADLFLQQFGHLAQGEGGIKKLRDVILQLAVHGKLVAQNSADEPAEVLLKKIAVARKNFASDYKLNTSKENQPVIASQIPYKLPYSWQWVRLSNIGIIVGGGTPSSGNTEYFCDNGGIAWLTPADMYALKSKFVSHGRRDLTPAGLSNSSAQIMPKGSVLFSSRAPIGYVAIAVNEVTTNQGFKSCVPFIGEMSEYIYYYLKSAVRYIESLASGTTFMEVSGKVVANILFPLPPLAEQKRIVAKVDELMTLCDRLEAEQKSQRTLKTQAAQSTLHHLTNAKSPASFGTSLNILECTFNKWFDDLATVKQLRATILQLAVQGKLVPQNPTDEPASELLKRIDAEKKRLVKEKLIRKTSDTLPISPSAHPVVLPKNWQWVRFGWLFKSSEYGTSEKSSERGDVPVYSMGHIQDGLLTNKPFKFLRQDSDELPKLYLRNKDILFNRTNSYELVGKSAVYTGKTNTHTFASYLIRVELLHDFVDCYFANKYLNSPLCRVTQIEPEITNQTNQANYNGTKLQNILFPLPPLAEQKRIVAKVDELMTLCDQLEADITHTKTLNTHLMDSLIHRMTEAV